MTSSLLGKTRLMVIFKVDGQSCAMELDHLQEITPLAELSCPPGLPTILKGFLNLGGKTIPVLHLAQLFHLNEEAPGLYGHLLILKTKDKQLALLVEYAEEILEIDQKKISPVEQKHFLNDCVKEEINLDGRMIHILSTDRLLLSEESARISDLQVLELERLKRVVEAKS